MFTAKKGLLVLLLGLLLTAAACQPATTSTTEPAPADTAAEAPAEAPAEEAAEAPAETAMLPEVTFVGTEYAYDGPESIAGGWTKVTFDNQGEMPHDLLLLRLDEGKTMDDVMAILADENAAPPAWIDMVGGASAGPGESKSFVTDLKPGSYAMFSFGESEDGPPDAAQGMVGSLTVTEATAAVDESALPEAAGSIELVDYQFVINGLKSGEQIVRMSNSGTELHEAVAFRLNEGATMEEFMAFLQSEFGGEAAPDGPPPVDGEPTVLGFLSPGNVTYTTVNLDPGNYIFLCFLPSEKNDNTPHVMLGMITEVAVE